MPTVTPEMREETKEIIYNFYAEECNVDKATLNENSNVIEDIGGDSLMFLELLSLFKKKYGINVEIKSIGKYVLKHPSATLGKILDLTILIIEHGDKIADLA